MKRTHLFTSLFTSCCMLILILDGETALAGAKSGIALCFRTVVPALFPYIFLSILLTNASISTTFSILRPIEKLCSVPEGSGAILISGFLGGYPTGAHSVYTAYTSGALTRKDAERMLSFCNNAGPAFLFGMVSTLFPSKSATFLIWGILTVSTLLVAILNTAPSNSNYRITSPEILSPAKSMNLARNAIAAICGWVILFRILSSFLDRWFLWMIPLPAQVIVTGILELTNGCHMLSSIQNTGLRFILCACLLSLGGICVTLQTQSAAPELSMLPYLKGKLTQTIFTFLLSTAYVLNVGIPVLLILVLLVVILSKAQKRSGNPAAIGV